MKTTAFEQALAIGINEFSKFLHDMVEKARFDEDVTPEMYAYAVEMRAAVYDAFEEYSAKSFKLHGGEKLESHVNEEPINLTNLT